MSIAHTPARPLTDVEWLPSLAADLRYTPVARVVLASGQIKKVAAWLRERFAPWAVTAAQPGLLAALRWSGDAHQDSVAIELIDEARQALLGKGKAASELFTGIVEAWLERLPTGALRTLEQCLAATLLLERHRELSDAVLVRLWRVVHERTENHAARAGELTPSSVLLRMEANLLALLATSPQPVRNADLVPVRDAIRELLSRFTDEEGHPLAALHGVLGQLLATLVRLSQIAERAELKLIEKSTRREMRTLVIDAVSLFPHDARWVPSRTPHEAVGWLERVIECFDAGDDEGTSRLLKHWQNVALSQPGKKITAKASRKAAAKVVAPPALKKKQVRSHQSDGARYACLFGDWRESRDRIIARYPTGQLELDGAVDNHLLFSGDWTGELTIGGKSLSSGEWTCCCWYSDEEADFCELKSEPAPGVERYRQIVLSRRDQFLLIADEVRAPGKADIQLTSHLPLASGWKAVADGRSREWQLQQPGSTVRIFPVFAAQNRIVGTDRQATVAEQKLTFGGHAAATGLYTGIVLDWSPARRMEPATWSPVTVSEDRVRVTPERACAARWRVGDSLWMVFHQSIKGDSPRAVLGMHSNYESVFTRVEDGEYKFLVMVE